MPRKSTSSYADVSSPSSPAKWEILPDDVKCFIIECLACGDTPGEAAHGVRIEFGVRVSPQRVTRYDPRWTRGNALCAPFKELFFSVRREFALGTRDHPHALYQIKIRLAALTNDAMDRARDGRPMSRALNRVRREERRVEATKKVWENRRAKVRRALFPDGLGLIGEKTDLSNLTSEERTVLAKLDAKCRAMPSCYRDQ